MELVPFVGNVQLTATSVVVKVNPLDQERAEDLVLRTSTIVQVTDQESFLYAKRAAATLKSMIDEIGLSKKSAKQPFAAVESAINELAATVNTPVEDEYRRILRLMKPYVEQIEVERKAAEARRLAAQREAERKIAEAKAAQAKAQSQNDRALAELNLARAQVDRAMSVEAAKVTQASVIPGGRVTHPYEFKLVDPAKVFAAGKIGLLRIELDILACNDAVKAQLSDAPEGTLPQLPGIEITQETNISIKAAART